MFRTNSKHSLRLVLFLGISILPVVLGQFWNKNTYPEYAYNPEFYQPQYQGMSTSESAVAGAGGQQTGQSQSNSNNNSDSDDDLDAEDVAYMKNYLHKYEYLPHLRTPNEKEDPEELREAIIRLQKMAGVEVTGILNNETLARIRDTPRCGNSDKSVDKEEMRRKRRFAIQHGWTKKKLTWAIKNYTPDIAQATTRRVLTAAFNVWSDVAQLDFQETKFPRADILVLFARASHGDGYAFDGSGGTLAHAYFPGDGIGGDVHFDEDEQFSDRTRTGTNLFIVAAHEIGHSLGLAHSEASGSLMAPYYQGYQPSFNLPSDDVRGIQSLYGARANPRPGPRPPPGGPNPPSQGPKDRAVCNAPISAVSYGIITGAPQPSLYMFSGETLWVKRGNQPVSFAMQTETEFPDMQSPPDAAFIRTHRGQRRMVFFSGQEIWEFIRGTYQPRDIRERTGIRTNGIDAAFKWNRNKKIYVFYSGLYWRLNENSLRVDAGYPRVVKDNWRGRKGPFSAVWTEGKDGVSYFLINKQVHTFKDNEVFFVTPTRSFASDWLKCGGNLSGANSVAPNILVTSLLMFLAATLQRLL